MEEEEKKCYNMLEQLNELTPYELSKFILIVVVTIALGFVILNGFIKFNYYNRVMSNPCDVCLEDNPELMLTPNIQEYIIGEPISQEYLLYNSTFDLRVPS